MSDTKRLFKDSTAASARYGDVVATVFGEWELVHERAEADYQGSCNFIVRKHDPYSWSDGRERFAIGAWSYGSCSGCDSWEDSGASDAEIIRDVLSGTRFLNRAAVTAFVEKLPKFDPEDYWPGEWGNAAEAWAKFLAENPEEVDE